MTNNKKKGFGVVAIIVIIAVLAIGGGAYYVSNTPVKNTENKENKEITATSTGSAKVTATSTVEINTSGTIRSLFAMGKTVKCTIEGSESTGNTSGIIYIESEARMRGDFTTKTSNGSVVESHMIKSGDTVYTWTGTQGAKMDASSAMSAEAGAKANVNWDEKVDYTCVDWSKDESKFVVPSTVNFIDVNAMLKGNLSY